MKDLLKLIALYNELPTEFKRLIWIKIEEIQHTPSVASGDQMVSTNTHQSVQ